MTLILSRDFTGTNGDHWADHGFERLVGSINATIVSNAGGCGASAQERIYAITGYPQSPGHTLACDLDWANAVGAGRAPGLGVRFSRDGADGYVAQIDSNINATRVRIRRRNSGVWTDVLAWTLVPAVTGATLNAGVTAALKVENVTGGVRLTLFIDGTQYAQATDTDAARHEGSGLCVLYIDSVSTTTDVTYDTVEISDFESEHASPAELASGLALVVDGTYYTEADLTAAGVYVTGSRKSLDKGTVGEIRTAQLLDNETGIVYVGALVKVLWNGAVQAYGRVQPSTRRIAPGEGRTYSIVGPRDLAADVLIQHPTTLANSVTWNLPESHAEYDASLDSVSIGTAIQQLFDTHSDGDYGLRAHFAAPPDEDVPAYDAAELALLTSAPVGMSASGDVLSAIEQLLALTKYALKIDPDTLIWHVVPRLSGTIRTVALDDDHVLGEYVIDPSRNFTKARLTGERPEITMTTLTNEVGGGLDKGWPAALEATHNSEKALKNTDTGLVASIGGTVGNPTVVRDAVGPPAFTMEADEWIGGVLGFDDGPEAGNTYPVTNNTVSTFTLTGPWLAGGPVAGNTFRVSGNAAGGGRDNGHKILGRRFELSDATLGIPSDVCALVKIRQEKIEAITKAVVNTPTDPTEKASITLDAPAKGLANYTEQDHTEPCVEGDAGATSIARVEVTLPTYSRTSPNVPTLDYPDPGYTGTAFSYDAAKYGTTQRPGKGDVGKMSIFPLHAPEYDGSAAQSTKWTAVMQEILAILSPLSRSVTLTIHGRIEAGWDVCERLQLSGAGAPSELTTCTDLDILAIEQHYQGGLKTVIYAGSQAAGEYDVQAMRREMQARHGIRATKRALNQFQELLNCLKGNTHSAGYEPPPDITQKCANQVSSGVTRAGRSVTEDFEAILKVLKGLGKIIEAQKGGTFEPHDPNSSDPLIYTRGDGQKFYLQSDGTWRSAGPNNIVGDGDDVDVPAPHVNPDDLDPQSIEGQIWAAVELLLDFLFAQKGWLVDFDSAGNIWLGQTASGPWVYSEDGGDTWKNDVGGEGPGGGPAGGDTPAGSPLPDGPEDLAPTSIEGKMWAAIEQLRKNKAHLEKALGGMAAGPGGATPINRITAHDGSVYDVDETGATYVSGPGLAGPDIGGTTGALAGKCGSTLDGKAAFASGPGTVLVPGDTVGVDGAYYHPPTDDLADVVQLASGDTVPAHSQDQMRALASEQSLIPYVMNDPGGVVYYDEAHKSGTWLRLWRCEAGTQRFIEVESTPGTGLNGGDYSDVVPTRYHEGPGRGGTMKRAVTVATAAALPTCTLVEPSLTATANGALTVDGRALAVGERVLVKDQVALNENGIYTVFAAGSVGAPWVLRRSLDTARHDSTLSGALVLVREGSTLANTLWYLDTDTPVEPGTDNQTWAQFTGGGGGLSPGVLLAVTTYKTAAGSPFTHNMNASTQAAVVELVGAGGGGGGVGACPAGMSAAGGGGASGGRIVETIIGPAPSYAVTVGAAGAAGAAGGGAGGAGGNTTFGGTLTAPGGAGGGFLAPAAAFTAVLGGASAAAAGASAAGVDGGCNPGGHGMRGGAALAFGGNGACGHFGGGGQGGLGGAAPQGAQAPGGGGGGASQIAGGGPIAGGAGFDGVVIVYEYA